MSDTIIARCEAKGLRMTGQRRTIAQVLQQSEDHPDVEELYSRASEVDFLGFQSPRSIAP